MSKRPTRKYHSKYRGQAPVLKTECERFGMVAVKPAFCEVWNGYYGVYCEAPKGHKGEHRGTGDRVYYWPSWT